MDEKKELILLEQRYQLSSVLISAVKHGNLSLALKLYQPLEDDIGQIKRNHNPLRSAQNLLISTNSLLRYACEECGVHPYLLDKVSNEIGLKIEQVKSISEAKEYSRETICTYCQLVQNNLYPNVSPMIKSAIAYTKAHLSDTVTAKNTAAALGLNADYFSHLFCTEMGVTFISFLNKERIEQAASLLTSTSFQVQQIAALVGYNNCNYFSKQFQKYYEVTPLQYKKRKIGT